MFQIPRALSQGARLLAACGLSLSLVGAVQAELAAGSAASREAPSGVANAIKQALQQRMPDMPAVVSVRPAPVAGLYEVQAGTQLIYTDAKAEYIVEGNVLETRTMRNLTEERLDEINKVDFDNLPFKDAIVWKNGSGKRRMVVFSDPNCGYCKRLEKDLQQIKDVTVYTFMVGILGEDSKVKLNNIWCVKDRTQVYRDWMLAGVEPTRAFGMCNNPGTRNLALAQKFRISGTPAMFFEDGSRLASAAPANVVEQRLIKATSKAGG
jgi:thiol:disulfide interchange protein DsbC